METQETKWTEGLSDKAVEAIGRLFEEANRQDDKINRAKLTAGRALRTILSHYLRGDRKRFEAAAEGTLKIAVSTAYMYVQAVEALDAFGPDIAKVGTDPNGVAVQALAKLDRFRGSEEKQDDGKAIIASEAARAAKEGTEAFTVRGLADTITASKGGGSGGGDGDKRVARVAGKYRDALATLYLQCEAVAVKGGPMAAYNHAVLFGAEVGAAQGSVASVALKALMIEAAAVAKAEAKAEATAKAAAEAKVKAKAEAGKALNAERPSKPAATVTEERPKRTPAKAKAKGQPLTTSRIMREAGLK